MTLEDAEIQQRRVEKRKESVINSFNSGCVWKAAVEEEAELNTSTHGALRLHSDVLEFYNFVSLREEELNLRKLLVEAIEEVVLNLWPEASLVVHGSLATGTILHLYLHYTRYLQELIKMRCILHSTIRIDVAYF